MKLIICKSQDGTFEIWEMNNFSNHVATGIKTIEAVGNFVRIHDGVLGPVRSSDLIGRYREASIPDSWVPNK